MSGSPRRLAFLVYDSRSGSTLLSREIRGFLEGVCVTPEIGFDELFRVGEPGLQKYGWPELLRRLYSGHEFINFRISQKRALQLLCPDDGQVVGLVEGIRRLLDAYCGEYFGSECNWIVVKNGTHIRYWRTMHRLFGDELVLLHIVRDPRAVINSKLKTPRPYQPEEMMAWGGALLASLRWRNYVREVEGAQQEGVRIYQLRYEDLIKAPRENMERLATFLGVKIRMKADAQRYFIPSAEKEIHKEVMKPGINIRRQEAWIEELPKHDRFQIEALCYRDMKRFGYQVPGRLYRRLQSLALVAGLPRTMAGTLKHLRLKMRP